MSESSSYDRTRPDLKPQYSLSSTTKQPSSLLQNSMNSNVFYTSEPLARPPTHMSNQYLSTPFSPTNNGYIRQRSTSLLPINSYTQNTADLDTGMKNLSFEHLYMPPPPRMGMGYSVSNDGFNSPFYPPESKFHFLHERM
jgi:hypothetical protein